MKCYKGEHCSDDWCASCGGEFSIGGRAKMYEDLWIKAAKDHLGAACRDNSRDELIHIGKQIEEGTYLN